MRCIKCESNMHACLITDVTDLGSCLVIVRNVPCFKCEECDEVFYRGTVVNQLKKIVELAKNSVNEIAIIDYNKQVAKKTAPFFCEKRAVLFLIN